MLAAQTGLELSLDRLTNICICDIVFPDQDVAKSSSRGRDGRGCL